MKTGSAHTCSPGQIFDSKRLAKIFSQPCDRDANALRLTVCLCHVVQNPAALVQQQAEQNLPLKYRGEHVNLRWTSQQSNQAQYCVEQSGVAGET